MTKVTTLFDDNVKSIKKKIEFVKVINLRTGEVEDEVEYTASDFDNVKLIASKGKYDLIAAWDEGSDYSYVFIYLGHWNDGIV